MIYFSLYCQAVSSEMYDCNFDQSVAWNIHMWYMIVFMMLPGRVIKNFIIFIAQTSCLFINHTKMLYGLLFQIPNNLRFLSKCTDVLLFRNCFITFIRNTSLWTNIFINDEWQVNWKYRPAFAFLITIHPHSIIPHHRSIYLIIITPLLQQPHSFSSSSSSDPPYLTDLHLKFLLRRQRTQY